MGNPDVKKYKAWRIGEIMVWMANLEDGRFQKYCLQIMEGLVASDILQGEFLPDINEAMLSVEPFNISSFPDKRDLVRHFRSLAATGTDSDVAAPAVMCQGQEGTRTVGYIA